ncbi:P-loop NTPase fold protein, partial [Sphaerobacter thermophilus]|uniref:P-loop NTPase fold protein n=1 Tax=Sphaerobacter thermophilus TaxID=2057 RepID=UPI0039C450B4
MQTIDPARKGITLPDQPSDKDAFGAHREIAAAIAQMISTENGGVTIGLEGTWGSGKSTVVKLLTEHLNQRQCCVFSYDSWAHEGDPLRRSFLESLGEHLASEKWRWLDASYWKEERERLAGRRSKTKTKIRQHVTRNGRWLIAVVLATPIGMSIFNLGVSQADTDTPFRARLFNLAVGGLIAGGPLWMALGLFVRRVWRKLFKSDQPRA